MRLLFILAAVAGLLFLAAAALSALLRATAAVGRRLRLALTAAGLSVSGGVAVGALAGQNTSYDPVTSGIAGAVVLFSPLALSLRALERRQLARSRAAPPDASGPSKSPPAAGATPIETQAQRSWFGWRRRRPETAADQAVVAAWTALAAVAEQAGSRVAVARASCERLLRAADAGPLEPDVLEWAAFIRTRLPPLVESGLKKQGRTSATAQSAVVEELVETVERIGAEADRRLMAARKDQRTDFDLQREHVFRRTSRDPFAP